MKNIDPNLERLLAAARRAPAGDEAAPFGFSTRVAALAFSQERPVSPSFARLSLRAAGVAFVFAAVAVGMNYSAIATALDDDTAAAAPAAVPDDPVSEVASLGS